MENTLEMFNKRAYILSVIYVNREYHWKSMRLDGESVGFAKHFCTKSQKVKSFSDENDNKWKKNGTFVAEVLYYTQNIGKWT